VGKKELPQLGCFRQYTGNGKEAYMESLRDVKRVMEREVKKGSCPLMFDRLEFGGRPFQPIVSGEKLDEVLAYLLRVKSFQQYAEKTIINNVYMDNARRYSCSRKKGSGTLPGINMPCRKPQFRRTHSVIEREGIYAGVQKYIKCTCQQKLVLPQTAVKASLNSR